MKYFVLPDIHGCQEQLENALEKWDSKNQQLIQLGDMVDRGPDSLSVLLTLMRLQKEKNAVILKGNHEEKFLDFLENPEEEGLWYFPAGGRETVDSFFKQEVAYRKTPNYIADYIQTQFPDVVEFLKNLPSYYEEGKWVFVHAGVNLSYKDWRYSSDKEFLCIRSDFHYPTNEHDARFVFGHTPTRNLNVDKSDDVWVSSCGTKIGIDGALVFGGQTNILHIDGDSYRTEVIKR